MDISAEERGPTEGIVLALLDQLVEPLLPSKYVAGEPPEQEDLVSKQVHAVVLLYNYYHRKQNPGLEFLDFMSFCKLAVVLKPSFKSYTRLLESSDYDGLEVDDMEKHMSLTEKEVKNACDICRSLDVSKDEPIIAGWPISQVAVFLVDSKKENCFLFYSSITQGVWSLVEKVVTLPGEDGYINKKKRVIRKAPRETQNVDEAVLRQFAYTAVKEACAFNQADLKILETHTVYSTSKANTAARLYILQCSQSNQDLNLVPISDVLESLQGPLVSKESGSWLVTPVVEYFHLLPFADKVSNWLSRSREMHENGTALVDNAKAGHRDSFENLKDLDNRTSYSINEKVVVNSSGSVGVPKDARTTNNHQSKEVLISNRPQHGDATQAVGNGSCHQPGDIILRSSDPLPDTVKDVTNDSASNSKKEVLPSPCVSNHFGTPVIVEANCGSRRKDITTEPVVYKKRNRPQKNISSNNVGSKTSNATTKYVRQEEGCAVSGSPSSVDIHETSKTCPAFNGLPNNFTCTDRTEVQKQIIIAQEPIQSAFSGGAMVVAENTEKLYSDQDRAIVSFNSNPEYLQKIQLTIASKEDKLSQTALKVLFRKRELLSQQLRNIADEIALCDRNIEIIKKGGEDDLAVKIDSVMEGCNDLFRRSSATEDKTGLQFDNPDTAPLVKRKRISEANMPLHDPCQELDRISNNNSWSLPTYNISTSEGGFQATVTVTGADFDCSSEGTIYPTPQDARRSAASHLLVKISNMIVEM